MTARITRDYSLVGLTHTTLLETIFELEVSFFPDVSPFIEIVFSTDADQMAFRLALNETLIEGENLFCAEHSILVPFGRTYIDAVLDQLSLAHHVHVVERVRVEMRTSRDHDRLLAALDIIAAASHKPCWTYCS